MVLAITYNCFLTLGTKSECILKENEVLHKDNDDDDDVNDTDDVNDNDDVNDGDVEQNATSPPKRKK